MLAGSDNGLETSNVEGDKNYIDVSLEERNGSIRTPTQVRSRQPLIVAKRPLTILQKAKGKNPP